ncbi:beta-lactamase [Bifidobacterium sp. DSM 109958]|uniref:Beta-lactamase n=1 Tax=Bifidobacterium moraviense TaxID=2675323 RepID=A0A7Y0F1X6_9BIFI|nr:serine hydrolase [Bifidobacterium sp. DSM 109958]NMN00539.1 beta-lactamase [Bifidobacterium sp. DSM 109958]
MPRSVSSSSPSPSSSRRSSPKTGAPNARVRHAAHGIHAGSGSSSRSTRGGARKGRGNARGNGGFGRVRMLKGETYTRRRILVACLGVLLLVELFQLFWPSDKFFPMATLDGHAVGGQSAAQVAETLNAESLARNVTLTDQSTGRRITLAAKDAGITVDYAGRAQAAAHHSFASRIIPFSWLFVHNTTADTLPDAFGTSADPVKSDVRNAGLEVRDGALATVAAQDGYSFNPADVRTAAGKAFAATTDGDLAAATLNLNIVEPTVATATADQLRATLTTALGGGVTFTYGSGADAGTYQLSAVDVAGTIAVAQDAQDQSKLVASVDSSRLSSLFKDKGVAIDVAKRAVAAGAVPETFATDARASRAVDVAKTADALADMLNGGASRPVEITSRTITNAALYENLPAEGTIQDKLKTLFGNATYSVAVYDLKTGEEKLTVDADRVTTSASTYKLFIAHSMIEAVESGKLTWNSPLNGMTLNACLTTMIVNSDNACPEAWLRQYGFDTVTKQAHEIGANNTNFARGNMRTTANDLATILKGYYSNTIATKASTDRLFPLMQTQVYREGIPTGIGSDGVVQDKVGFLNALLHDAAIVRCDKGDYAMVIMTEHSSWSKIAQASLLIYDEL